MVGVPGTSGPISAATNNTLAQGSKEDDEIIGKIKDLQITAPAPRNGLELDVSTHLNYYYHVKLHDSERYFVSLCTKLTGQPIFVFASTLDETHYLALILRYFGMNATPLYSSMGRSNGFDALREFRSGPHRILITTDRLCPLHVPEADHILNFNLPTTAKNYIWRIRRVSPDKKCNVINFASQHDMGVVNHLETALKIPLAKYDLEESAMVSPMRIHNAQMEVKRVMELND